MNITLKKLYCFSSNDLFERFIKNMAKKAKNRSNRIKNLIFLKTIHKINKLPKQLIDMVFFIYLLIDFNNYFSLVLIKINTFLKNISLTEPIKCII